MIWEKLGLLYSTKSNNFWKISHAALPSAIHLRDDVFRIFYSARDKENRSHGTYVDIDIISKEVIKDPDLSIIQPGEIGLFHDSGVSLSCFLKENNLFYLMGWSLQKNVPYSNHIGAAVFQGEQLKLISNLPILNKCENELYSFGYPWVVYHEKKYQMWYDTVLEWKENSTKQYICSLRYAESFDGINWNKKDIDCIPLLPNERCIARPCVLIEENIYKMWYSIFDNTGYKMGYAESNDGITWRRRDDEVGLFVSDSGWDSEMVEYPFVFNHNDNKYMLYNGNGYGKTGFGLARLVK